MMSGHGTRWISEARRREIDDNATILLVELWRNNSPSKPLDVVSPGIALEHLGYRVDSGDLGQEYIDGALAHVAGLINFERKQV